MEELTDVKEAKNWRGRKENPSNVKEKEDFEKTERHKGRTARI